MIGAGVGALVDGSDEGSDEGSDDGSDDGSDEGFDDFDGSTEGSDEGSFDLNVVVTFGSDAAEITVEMLFRPVIGSAFKLLCMDVVISAD